MKLLADTALVTASYDNDKRKIYATKKSILNLLKQNPRPIIVFVELLFNTNQSNYNFSGNQGFKHIIIQGNDSNKNLCQKEALFNIGASHCKECRYLIFLDCDLLIEPPNWVFQIRNKLLHNWKLVVQGFKSLTDSSNKGYSFTGISYHQITKNLIYNKKHFGACWALSRRLFSINGGFNIWSITGLGDKIFLYEYTQNTIDDCQLSKFRWLDTIKRQIQIKASIDFIDTNIKRIYHDDIENQKYKEKSNILDYFQHNIKDFVHEDHNHLLAWNTTECAERELLTTNGNFDNNYVEKVFSKYSEKTNIVHAINLALFKSKPQLRVIQEMTIESIQTASEHSESITNVACIDSSDDIKVPLNWKCSRLNRNAISTLNYSKNFPYLKDILKAASIYTRDDNSWIVFTNTDCAVSKDFYNHIQESKSDIIHFHRNNVYGHPLNLEQLFSFRRQLEVYGIDGFAIKKKVYNKFIDIFPDFLIGAPVWDNTLEILSYHYIKNVEENIIDIFHIDHPRRWDPKNPDIAGKYNHSIAMKFVDNKEKVFFPSKIFKSDCNTSVIIPAFGDDPERINAITKAFSNLQNQSLKVEYIFVELLFNTNKTNFPFLDKMKNVNHIITEGNDKNKFLMQKECLNNIGGNRATGEYLIFLDSDHYCSDPNWFFKIREKLIEKENYLIHGFRTIKDEVDPRLYWRSIAFAHSKEDTGIPKAIAPGGCWGMSRKIFDDANGFNCWCIMGSGDSSIMCEFLKHNPESKWLPLFRWWNEIKRDININAEIDYTPVDVIHAYHGPFKIRNYNQSRYVLDNLKPIKEYVFLNENGILEWKSLYSYEYRVLKRKKEMISKEARLSILQEEQI